MFDRALACSLSIALLLALGGCVAKPPPQAAPPPPPPEAPPPPAAPPTPRAAAPAPAAAETAAAGGVLYHWVQVVSRSAVGAAGPGSAAPVLVARAVVDDADGRAACPTLTADSASAAMVPRRANEDPEAFPVLVCEARVPADADTVTIGGRPLGFSPAALGPLAAHPVVVGDTGCKGPDAEDCPAAGSDPDDPDGWGFPKVAGVIAAGTAPSLIVHVGDFLYRRMPEEPGCEPKAPCDVWTAWREDFFAPAEDLLPAAPWLMARGNHETCTDEPRVEGGNGWFLFLSPVTPCMDPGDALPGCSQPVALRTCRSPDAGFPAPWAVDLALPRGSPAPSVRAVVMDTSAAKPVDDSGGLAATYRRQYQALPALLGDAARGWLVTHVPIYAAAKIKGSTDQKLETVNQNLQAATRGLALPPALQLALVGHRHIVQTVNSVNAEDAALVPPHLIMGASGVALSGEKLPRGTYFGTTETGLPDATGKATLVGWIQRAHSYADLTADTGRVAWRIAIVDAAGETLGDCALSTGTPGWGTALTCKATGP